MVAMLLNETSGQLRQHLQLLAGTGRKYNLMKATIMEYFRATTALRKMQATQQAPSSSVAATYNGHSSSYIPSRRALPSPEQATATRRVDNITVTTSKQHEPQHEQRDQSAIKHKVFTKIHIKDTRPEQRNSPISSRRVRRAKELAQRSTTK